MYSALFIQIALKSNGIVKCRVIFHFKLFRNLSILPEKVIKEPDVLNEIMLVKSKPGKPLDIFILLFMQILLKQTGYTLLLCMEVIMR